MSQFSKPKLTQAIFNGWAADFRFATVDSRSYVYLHKYAPFPQGGIFDIEWRGDRNAQVFVCAGYDSSDWQNSLIERETVIPVSEQNQEPSWANRPVMPAPTGNPVNVTYESLYKVREIFEQADAENFNWQADSMVSYKIDDLSIEQLRHGYRCLLLSGRESHLLHMKDKAAIATRLLDAESTVNTLLDALLNALPYVEDVLNDPDQLAQFKAGVVQKHATQIRAAIALAEKHEYGHQSEVTESQLLDSLKSLIKLNGHRDPISDKLLPPDLQPDPEIGEAMRLVVRAGGAV